MKKLPTTTPFGSTIRATRREWQVTQSDFGRICGFSSQYISGIERGHKIPPLGTQAHIRRIIDLGKEEALKQTKSARSTARRASSFGYGHPDVPSLDCTALIHAVAASDLSVTINDLLWLLEIQQTLPSPMEVGLVSKLLKNRQKEKK